LIPSKAEGITLFSRCNSALSGSVVLVALNGKRDQPWRQPEKHAARQTWH
jgi:hypothetical protein